MSQSHTDAPATQADQPRAHRAGAFDIRVFIAMLIGVYGAVLVVTGLVATPDEALARADGLNINLWAGVGMVAVAAAFVVWARVRPVVVPEEPDEVEGREKSDQSTR